MVEPTQLPRYTRDDFRLVVESSPPPPPPAPAGTQAQAGGTNADTLLEGLTWSAAQPGDLPAAEAFLAPDRTVPVAPDQMVPVAPDRTVPVVG
ncbi:MAG: hypothetical protein ABIQ39_14235, partial [Ilumatobacteraceae bacterium]